MVNAFPHLRFEKPVFLLYPPDKTNRIFVLEQDGRVLWFPNDPDIRAASVAVDIRPRVRRWHTEEGLLGMAFHPDFAKNRWVFLHYSASKPRRNVLSRFSMNRKGTKILPGSEKVLLEVRQPHGNHNGGMIAFGPDGYLYISLGDGGSAGDPDNNGQTLSTLLGAILRIDVNEDSSPPSYAVPANNPFVKKGEARPEIFAYGLRNVWRFSFDRKTGDLWAGDVGQNAREEVNLIRPGGNYGWNFREGRIPYREGAPAGLKFKEPVFDLPREDARSVTGGYVYRGLRYPKWDGVYLVGDFVTGNLWGYGGFLGETGPVSVGKTPLIASFGEDERGEIYVVSYDGTIRRLVLN